MMIFSRCRLFITGLLLVVMLAVPFGGAARVEASSFLENLLYGALAYSYVNGQLINLDENHQDDMFAKTQEQTGVYDDPEANRYVQKMAERLMGNGLIKGHYKVYIAPKKEFNAFCTLGKVVAVNKGALDCLDEDELAAVLGHEFSHGEHRDCVEGTRKIIGLSLAVDIFLLRDATLMQNVLGTIATNYIANEVITMNQEWEADNSGFDNAVAAGYNPGGGAASMVKLRAQLGELWTEGLMRTVSPNNHPRTTDRVNNFAKHLTDYSGGHISVKDDTAVLIDGQEFVRPVKTEKYMAEERAYLVAGNLARVYHDKLFGAVTSNPDGAIFIGDKAVMTSCAGDDGAEALVQRLEPFIAVEEAKAVAAAELAAVKAKAAEKPADDKQAQTAEKPADDKQAQTAEKPADDKQAQTAEKPADDKQAQTAEKPADDKQAQTAEKQAEAPAAIDDHE